MNKNNLMIYFYFTNLTISFFTAAYLYGYKIAAITDFVVPFGAFLLTLGIFGVIVATRKRGSE